VDVIESGDHIVWRHHLELGDDDPPGVHEFVMASFLTAVRRIVQADVSPLAVHFIHDVPGYSAEYAKLFRAPCHFGADYNAFVLPRQAAELRLPTADPALFRMMKRRAGEVLARLPHRQLFRSRVRAAIDADLARGGASLKSVARSLALGQRTVRRRLRERGITYLELLDEARRERVCELLTSSDASLESIAVQTGFSHATALHRAFRRWYGVTPARFRKRRHESAS
jgi:AraC-like DNA-binding protein